jgi:energy-coupling factor transport system ATP-binding protein
MIQLAHVTYAYPETSRPALRDVGLKVDAGEFVLLTGPSGGGKSTLLRVLNGLVPHFTGGRIGGNVQVDGRNPTHEGPATMSRHVGMVFQEPELQFVVDGVEDEIAFGLENAGVPRTEMRARVQDALARLGITHLRTRAIHSLSGGEQQRVAIASALVMQPQVLVLDEPTSQLDDESAEDVLKAVASLNRDLGLTVIMSEHRLERVLPFASRVVCMDEGALVDASSVLHPAFADRKPNDASRKTQDILQIIHLHATYGENTILHDVSLSVASGEVVALMGRSGSGKTTLLRCIVGLMRPAGGEVLVDGQRVINHDTADIARDVAYLPQNPNALLFADTISDELNITRKNHALAPFDEAQVEAMLAQLGIAQYAQAYPRDLSVGERQRAALGAVAAAQPKLLLLDEPTRGLDADAKCNLAQVLRRFADGGVGVLLVTHDQALVDLCANRTLRLVDGRCNDAGAGA